MLEPFDLPHHGSFALYVGGFLFRSEGTEVALVQKQTLEWQKGKLNGIGDKVELGELNSIPNLSWLVPLGKDCDGIVATVIYPA